MNELWHSIWELCTQWKNKRPYVANEGWCVEVTFYTVFYQKWKFCPSYCLPSLLSKTDPTADSFIHMKRIDSNLPLRLKSSRTIGCI